MARVPITARRMRRQVGPYITGPALLNGHVFGFDRLESKGPFGNLAPQTSNRAELRAVVAAVRTRHWRIGRYKGLVIATDSKYVTEGATKWAKSWIRNDWKTTAGEPVINKDLWQLFLGEVENMAQEGLVVQI
ncbi:hypothetical protein LQW54_001488 [Pestalotiopsis sp. IQ-011]